MYTLRRHYYVLAVITLVIALACKKSHSGGGEETEPGRTTYEESTAIFPNPERGFLRTLIRKSGEPGLVASELSQLRGQNISLVLRFFYLDAFKEQPISADELALFQSDLDKIRAAGLKAVIRFGYTDDMNGTDASFAIISQHLDQLSPLLEANKDVLAFMQAGFIGAYGEWHSSSNGLATTDNERLVLEKILSSIPAGLMVQVRTPGQKQAIFNTTNPVTVDIAYSNQEVARVGHHNDCFLTGGTDYGTYDNVELEKTYISNEANFVPTGGETCPPLNGYDPSCVEGRNEMKRLKWTYLNLDYYPPTIAAWRSSGCFDEFQRNLGYRLILVDSKFPDHASVNGSLAVDVNIVNRGYAPVYNKKRTAIVLKNLVSGTYTSIPLAADIRTVKPIGTVNILETVQLSGITAGTYELFLRISDSNSSVSERSEYSIRLANNNTWQETNGGLNDLKKQIIIE